MFLVLALACKGEPTPVVLPCDGAWPLHDPEQFFGAGNFVARLETEPVIGENTWLFDLRNSSDVPVTQASVTLEGEQLDGDGLIMDVLSTAGDGPGRYTLGPFDLPSAGGWEFSFLTSSGMETRPLRLELCIE